MGLLRHRELEPIQGKRLSRQLLLNRDFAGTSLVTGGVLNPVLVRDSRRRLHDPQSPAPTIPDQHLFNAQRLREIRDRLSRCCWYASEFDCVSWRSHWRTSSIPAPNTRHSPLSSDIVCNMRWRPSQLMLLRHIQVGQRAFECL